MDKKSLLNDPQVFPSDAVIATILKNGFNVYQKFIGGLHDRQINTKWRYYNDGKSWLAKGTCKKKLYFGFLFGIVSFALVCRCAHVIYRIGE